MLNEYYAIIGVLTFLLIIAVIFIYITYGTLKELNDYNDEVLEDLRLTINRYNRNWHHSRKLRRKLLEINFNTSTKTKIEEQVKNLVEENKKAR